MLDIFGYDREVKDKEILSSDNISMDLGEGKIALLQQVTAQYDHQIKPVYEVGSSALYFVNGQPMGSISFANIVGKSGFFNGFGLGGQACGELKTISINAVADSNCDYEIERNSTIKFEGAILKQIEFRVTAGEMFASTNGTFLVAKMLLSN